MILVIDVFLWSATIYLTLGVFYAVYFYLKGAASLDKGTHGTPWHFKLIIFPGVVLFWSVLFFKTLKT